VVKSASKSPQKVAKEPEDITKFEIKPSSAKKKQLDHLPESSSEFSELVPPESPKDSPSRN
jgi:hypothetical protein